MSFFERGLPGFRARARVIHAKEIPRQGHRFRLVERDV